MREYLVVFSSTHAALAFDSAFEDGSIVPVPPSVRAGCGMGQRFFAESNDDARIKVETLANKLDIAQNLDGLFLREGSGYTEV